MLSLGALGGANPPADFWRQKTLAKAATWLAGAQGSPSAPHSIPGSFTPLASRGSAGKCSTRRARL